MAMRRELLILGLVLFLIGCCVGYLFRAVGPDRYEVYPWQTNLYSGLYIMDRQSGRIYRVFVNEVQEVDGWPPGG